MSEFQLEEPPSQVRVIITLFGCMILAAFLQLGCEAIHEKLSLIVGNTDPAVVTGGLKLILGMLLCVCAFKSSGLLIGDKLAWKRRWTTVILFWILPPLLTLVIYPNFTTKPFRGSSIGFWLLSPIAEELIFTGFIYGQMVALFGKPSQASRGAFAAAPLVTAFLFSLYHWPNLRFTDGSGKVGLSYAEFQLLYTLLGAAWMLNIRRWTGTIWPAVLNHILVNVLATFL